MRKYLLLLLAYSFFGFQVVAAPLAEQELFDQLIESFETGSSPLQELSEANFCEEYHSCLSMRNAAIEFLYQVGDELSFTDAFSIWRFLNDHSAYLFTDEQQLDMKLLARLLKLPVFNFNIYPEEAYGFSSKLCAYQDLLLPKEKDYLSCKALLSDFNDPVENIEEILNFNGPQGSERTQLYMFCRTHREYPCYMMLKRAGGAWFEQGGEVWGHPGLAYSRKKKIPVKKDGHTPGGLLFVNGVMPEANKKIRIWKVPKTNSRLPKY